MNGRQKSWLEVVSDAIKQAKQLKVCEAGEGGEPNGVGKAGQGNVRTASPETEEMNRERLDTKRFQLLYAAELSARYHRRRATFLTNADTATNAITLCAGASSLGGLLAKATGPWPVGMAAIVTFTSILKIVTRLGSSANLHAGWFRRWSGLLTEIELIEHPDEVTVAKWMRDRGELDRDCVGELRALCVDCENITAKKLEVEGRQRRIDRLQRTLMQFGTWQRDFPFEAGSRHLPRRILSEASGGESASLLGEPGCMPGEAQETDFRVNWAVTVCAAVLSLVGGVALTIWGKFLIDPLLTRWGLL